MGVLYFWCKSDYMLICFEHKNSVIILLPLLLSIPLFHQFHTWKCIKLVGNLVPLPGLWIELVASNCLFQGKNQKAFPAWSSGSVTMTVSTRKTWGIIAISSSTENLLWILQRQYSGSLGRFGAFFCTHMLRHHVLMGVGGSTACSLPCFSAPHRPGEAADLSRQTPACIGSSWFPVWNICFNAGWASSHGGI